MPFYEAAGLMECEEGTSRVGLPDDYYDRLNENKEAFRDVFREEISESRQGGQTNEQFIVQFLRSIEHHEKFTESDEDYVHSVIDLVQEARPARQTTRKIKQAFEEMDSPTANPLDVLTILRDHIPDGLLEKDTRANDQDDKPREIILSAYRVNKGKEGNT